MPNLSEIIFRDQIDHAIMAVLDTPETRLNTARVIALVKARFAENDDITHEVIARRIYVLVESEHLIALGNVRKWRFSEIELAVT